MARFGSTVERTLTSARAAAVAVARWTLTAAVLALAGLAASAAGAALSGHDQQCLGCHADASLAKKLDNGESLPLHVDGGKFAKSVHGAMGCAVCHADITLESHPPLKGKIKSVRDNSLALAGACRTCHAEIHKQYEQSTHAALVREGNPAAPICTDCHSPHAVMAKSSYNETTGEPCSTCHDSIFKAYAGSVHGDARKHGNKQAPTCTACHSTHSVTASANEDKVKNACLGCHAGVVGAHQTWLPNAGHHLKTVSCPACHAPGVKRKVDLRLYNRDANRRVSDGEGVPKFEAHARAADGNGKGLDVQALQNVVHEFGGSGLDGRIILRGRLEVADGDDIHRLAPKASAVRACESCHRAGSDPFQSVTISVVGPDGRPVKYDARTDVLNSAVSVDAIGGFYVIGGTRITLLDALVALALVAGIGIPLAHLAFGWVSRRYAKRIGGREDS
jgi:hypothetical protein